MAYTYTALRDHVESALRDSTNATYSTGELDYNIVEGLRESAEYVKHLVMVPFNMESRTGYATSTSTGNLVDATESQFLSTDTGKRVHNTTDNTWADIISYSSSSQVGLSHDIMAADDAYEIYNKGCWQNNQINIESVEDYLWVEKVEYPVGTERNFNLEGNIITVWINFNPDDTSESDANKIVYVWFNKRHKLSQLTDFVGAVDYTSGYSKGDTSMVIDGLQASGTIEEDQEFTLASRPQVYTVTESATISGNEATVTFYPGLDADVANDIVVNFVQSTLPRKLEPVLVDLIKGRAIMDESNTHLNARSILDPKAWKNYLEASAVPYNNALAKLQAMAESKTSEILPMGA